MRRPKRRGCLDRTLRRILIALLSAIGALVIDILASVIDRNFSGQIDAACRWLVHVTERFLIAMSVIDAVVAAGVFLAAIAERLLVRHQHHTRR